MTLDKIFAFVINMKTAILFLSLLFIVFLVSVPLFFRVTCAAAVSPSVDQHGLRCFTAPGALLLHLPHRSDAQRRLKISLLLLNVVSWKSTIVIRCKPCTLLTDMKWSFFYFPPEAAVLFGEPRIFGGEFSLSELVKCGRLRVRQYARGWFECYCFVVSTSSNCDVKFVRWCNRLWSHLWGGACGCGLLWRLTRQENLHELQGTGKPAGDIQVTQPWGKDCHSIILIYCATIYISIYV